MELLFLGTSSGTPTKTRNVSGVALRASQSGHWSLIDCGEGTQHRILHTRLSLMDLRAVFVTHMHGDHCYGLPGLLASAGMLNRTRALFVVGPPQLAEFMRCVSATSQLNLAYPVEFISVDDLETSAVLPEFDVRATALSHRVASYAYTFTEQGLLPRLDAARLEAERIPAGPLWGQLQRGHDVVLDGGRIVRAADMLLAPRKARRVIIGGDNDTPDLLAGEAQTAEVLVHEATYTEAVLHKVGPGPQHSSARRVAEFAERSGIRNLVLTHFSPRYGQEKGGLPLKEIEDEARAAYSGNLFLASDFDQYALDKTGRLARLDSSGAG